MTNVRCHAAVMAHDTVSATIADVKIHSDIQVIRRAVSALGDVNIYPDVILTYDSVVLPSESARITIVSPIIHCRIMPFSGETASTVDFNGIAVIATDTIRFVPMANAAPFLSA